MATFTVNKNLCDLNYKNKNLILDNQFNSINTEEKNKFISVSNEKVWDIVTISNNNTVNRVKYNQFMLNRDTLPLQESRSIIGKGSPLIGSLNQPTIKIDCSITISGVGAGSNPNINNVTIGNIL